MIAILLLDGLSQEIQWDVFNTPFGIQGDSGEKIGFIEEEG
jgi:hypothetical protein